MASAKKARIIVEAVTSSAVRNLKKLGSTADSAFTKADSKVKRFGQGLKSAAGSIKNAGLVVGGMATAVAGAAVAYDKLISAQSKYEGLQKNLNVQIDRARESTSNLVSEMDLMVAANKASQFGLAKTDGEFSKLAGTAVKLGASIGVDATQSVNDLVEGLAKGSPEVLNNLGIIVKADDAYKKFADKLGVTVDELNAQGKQQAIANEGMRIAEERAKKLKDPITQQQKDWGKLKKEAEKFGIALREVVIENILAFVDKIKVLKREIIALMESLGLIDDHRVSRRGGVGFFKTAQPGSAAATREQEARDASASAAAAGTAASQKEKYTGGDESEDDKRNKIARIRAIRAERKKAAEEKAKQDAKEIEDILKKIELENKARQQVTERKQQISDEMQFRREMHAIALEEGLDPVDRKLKEIEANARLLEREEERISRMDDLNAREVAMAEHAAAVQENKFQRELVIHERRLEMIEAEKQRRKELGDTIGNVSAQVVTGLGRVLFEEGKFTKKSLKIFFNSMAKRHGLMALGEAARAAAAAAVGNIPGAIAHGKAAALHGGVAIAAGAAGALSGVGGGGGGGGAIAGGTGGAAGAGGDATGTGAESAGTSAIGSERDRIIAEERRKHAGNGVPFSPPADGPPPDSGSQSSAANSGGNVTVNATVLGATSEQVGLALDQLLQRTRRTAGA